MQTNIYKIYFKLTLAQIFWAGTFVAGQIALLNQPPVFTAFLRNALSSLGFVIVLLCLKQAKLRKPSKATFWPLLWMGFFGVFLYTSLVYWGLERTTAVSASLLIPTTQPLFTALLSILFFKESFKSRHIVGLIFGFIGATAVLSGAWSLKGSASEMLGNFLMLGGALSFSIYSIFGKVVLNELDPLETVTYSTVIGTLLLFPLALVLDANTLNFKALSISFWSSLMYLVIFAGILPYLWWYSGIKTLGVSKTAAITFLLPPFALILAVVILQQRASLLQIIGGFLGLIGVAFATGFIDSLKIKSLANTVNQE